MAYFEWNSDVELGHAQIDDEHKRLFALAETVVEAFSSTAEPGPREALLRALIDFAREHFAHEEALMRDSGYPDAQAHAKFHASLLAELETYCARVRMGSHTNPSGMIAYLWNWLTVHIHAADRQLATWLSSTPGPGVVAQTVQK